MHVARNNKLQNTLMHVPNFNRFSFIYHNFNFYTCTMATSGLAVTDERVYADQFGDVRIPQQCSCNSSILYSNRC